MTKPLYPHEKTLFIIAAVISILVWIGFIVFTKGIILLGLPIVWVLYLFVQSGFISRLKGTGALVSDSQFPDIQRRIKTCAEKTGLTVVPKVYILHGDGMFNAFATHFLRTHYIILLSDILDALEGDPEAINFYIGHEMGHIDRKHLFYAPFLSVALILPLLGAAYLRAREYTCDMYGALCCDPKAAQQGLAALGVGGKRYKTLNMDEYIGQTEETSGFWMSFHELIASYPWLVKRLARVSPGRDAKIPARHPLAYFIALFVPKINIMGIALIYLAIIIGGGMESIKHERTMLDTGQNDPQLWPTETLPPDETSALASFAEEENKKTPLVIDNITTLDRVSLDANDGALVYFYKILVDQGTIDFEALRQSMYQPQLDYWCRDPAALEIRQGQQIKVAHNYQDLNGQLVGEVLIDTTQCAP